MTDLFAPHHPDDEYLEGLKQDWNAVCADLQERRIIPPWINEDQILDADEYKIMSLVANTGGRVYYGGTDRRALADTLGFLSTGNLEAAMAKCVDRRLVRIALDKSNGRMRVSLTEYGNWMLQLEDDDD